MLTLRNACRVSIRDQHAFVGLIDSLSKSVWRYIAVQNSPKWQVTQLMIVFHFWAPEALALHPSCGNLPHSACLQDQPYLQGLFRHLRRVSATTQSVNQSWGYASSEIGKHSLQGHFAGPVKAGALSDEQLFQEASKRETLNLAKETFAE